MHAHYKETASRDRHVTIEKTHKNSSERIAGKCTTRACNPNIEEAKTMERLKNATSLSCCFFRPNSYNILLTAFSHAYDLAFSAPPVSPQIPCSLETGRTGCFPITKSPPALPQLSLRPSSMKFHSIGQRTTKKQQKINNALLTYTAPQRPTIPQSISCHNAPLAPSNSISVHPPLLVAATCAAPTNLTNHHRHHYRRWL